MIARIRALTKRAAPPSEKLDLNETIRDVLAIVGDEARKNRVAMRTAFADVGLDPNTMARTFEPFHTTKSVGMGMGLSISRSIVQHHGGRLWATANDGPGTRFHFSLPQYHEEEHNARVKGV